MLPHGQKVDYDIITQKHLSVVVFVWDTASATTTLVKEYHPGPNKVMLGAVAGMCENEKHTSILQAAQHELEEEAHLRTDHWYSLLNEGAIMPFDKYSNNRFIPYLALDCEPVKSAKPLDDEEYITIHRNVTYNEMMELMASGQINVVSTYTIMLGLKKLKDLGIKVG
ncbi:NUDIX hydrolase [archaeon]|nr:MAG: NUDIX hydrolase [archaeon]